MLWVSLQQPQLIGAVRQYDGGAALVVVLVQPGGPLAEQVLTPVVSNIKEGFLCILWILWSMPSGICSRAASGSMGTARKSDGQMDRFHSLPSFSLIFSTEQPYRAMSRALTIRLNASVSVIEYRTVKPDRDFSFL